MVLLPGQRYPCFSGKAILQGEEILISSSQYARRTKVTARHKKHQRLLKHSFKDALGRYAILVVYSSNFTLHNQNILLSLSDACSKFEEDDCVILGCTAESKYSVQNWLSLQRTEGGISNLEFPIICDPNFETVTKFGFEDSYFGSKLSSATVFILTPDERIGYVGIYTDPVNISITELSRVLESLKTLEPVELKGELVSDYSGGDCTGNSLKTQLYAKYFDSDLNLPKHDDLQELEILDIASQTDLSIFNQTDSSNQTDHHYNENQTLINQNHIGTQCDDISQSKHEKYCQTDAVILINQSSCTDSHPKEINSDKYCTEFKAKELIDNVISDIIVDVVERNESSSSSKKCSNWESCDLNTHLENNVVKPSKVKETLNIEAKAILEKSKPLNHVSINNLPIQKVPSLNGLEKDPKKKVKSALSGESTGVVLRTRSATVSRLKAETDRKAELSSQCDPRKPKSNTAEFRVSRMDMSSSNRVSRMETTSSAHPKKNNGCATS